jgi:dCMP deaminase
MDSTSSPSSRAVKSIYTENKKFIIIGLTGRTGSGCSTAAEILSSSEIELPADAYKGITENELRKHRIVRKFIKERWKPFHCLQLRTVITRHLLVLNFSELCRFAAETLGREQQDIREKLSDIKNVYDNLHAEVMEHISAPESNQHEVETKQRTAYKLYFSSLPDFSNTLRDHLKKISLDAYTKIYQTAGDNIRASGHANSSRFDETKVFGFPKLINKIIKAAHFIARENDVPCYIVIDAIRNPYEAIYFKERYASFYLVSINTENENRLDHLRKAHKFSEAQIEELDNKEYPSKLSGTKKFISQNIQKCIEISDIHIHNPRAEQYSNIELKCQISWYIALIMHPGLIMPTSLESCMQIAYTVKQSSGCISRQVGAVVTDEGFSVKAVGWNNTPQGQVPCLLRNAEDLLLGEDGSAYSNYEKNDQKFRIALEEKFEPLRKSALLDGRNLSFCFKDLQNEVEENKNQVHTRSLHAEENAFLQVAKHGGMALKGGVLFTTASPCELCSKKAYQLGISLIVYIDPYPGIATRHTLLVGSNSPRMQLYRGAVGRAYHQLYQPVMPYKDELETLLSIPSNANRKNSKAKAFETENRELKEQNEALRKEILDLKANNIHAPKVSPSQN